MVYGTIQLLFMRYSLQYVQIVGHAVFQITAPYEDENTLPLTLTLSHGGARGEKGMTLSH